MKRCGGCGSDNIRQFVMDGTIIYACCACYVNSGHRPEDWRDGYGPSVEMGLQTMSNANDRFKKSLGKDGAKELQRRIDAETKSKPNAQAAYDKLAEIQAREVEVYKVLQFYATCSPLARDDDAGLQAKEALKLFLPKEVRK